MTGTVETTIDTRRFQAQIPDEELTELRRRIEATGSASQALDGVRVRLRLAGLDAEDATRRSDGLRRRLGRIEERAGDAVLAFEMAQFDRQPVAIGAGGTAGWRSDTLWRGDNFKAWRVIAAIATMSSALALS